MDVQRFASHWARLTATIGGTGEFAEQMRYALPDPENAWVLAFKAEAGQGAGFERVTSIAGVFGEKVVYPITEGQAPRGIAWAFSVLSPPAEPSPVASLQCTTYGEGSPPMTIPLECSLDVGYGAGLFPELAEGVHFPLPYANIGDGRIVSKDPVSGIRLEAFRIGYD